MADEKKIVFKTVADFKAAIKEWEQLRDGVADTADEYKQANEEIKKLKTSMANITGEYKKSKEEIKKESEALKENNRKKKEQEAALKKIEAAQKKATDTQKKAEAAQKKAIDLRKKAIAVKNRAIIGHKNSQVEINKEIQLLQKEISVLDINSNAFKRKADSLRVLQGRLNQVKNATGNTTNSVLELGRIVQDAPYGLRGMGNNITQLATSFAFAQKEAGGFTKAIKGMWASLAGPLGIVLAISTVVSLLDIYQEKTRKSKKETNNFTKELGNQIQVLKVYRDFMYSVNTSLDERLGILKGLSKLDKDLATKLKEANGDRSKEIEILNEYIAQKELEVKVKSKLSEVEESNIKVKIDLENKLGAIRRLNDAKERQDQRSINTAKKDLNKFTKDLNKSEKERNKVFSEYLLLLKDIDLAEKNNEDTDDRDKIGTISSIKSTEEYAEDNMKMSKIFEDVFGYDEESLIEVGVKGQELIEGFQNSRTFIETKEAMNRMEIAEIEEEFKRDMMDNSLQHAQNIFRGLQQLTGDNKAIRGALIIAEKGAQVGQVIMDYNKTKMSNTKAAGGIIAQSVASGMPFPLALKAGVKYKKSADTLATINMAGSIAGIGVGAAKALSALGQGGSGGSGGSRGSGGSGGREFDFNLVGSTGNNQLAQAVGGQFQDQTVRAYVVGSDITNRQQLDNKIKTTATFGSDDD